MRFCRLGLRSLISFDDFIILIIDCCAPVSCRSASKFSALLLYSLVYSMGDAAVHLVITGCLVVFMNRSENCTKVCVSRRGNLALPRHSILARVLEARQGALSRRCFDAEVFLRLFSYTVDFYSRDEVGCGTPNTTDSYYCCLQVRWSQLFLADKSRPF
jgi:hypothetical protein